MLRMKCRSASAVPQHEMSKGLVIVDGNKGLRSGGCNSTLRIILIAALALNCGIFSSHGFFIRVPQTSVEWAR
jgi:hypothetical protein